MAQTGYRYFLSPDYVVVKAWICNMVLFPDNLVLTEPFNNRHVKFFPGMFGYNLVIVLCHCNVVVFGMFNNIKVATFPLF